MSAKPEKPAKEFRLTQEIDASPEAVWKALTEGAQIANWFAPEAETKGTGVGSEVTCGWSPEMRFTTKVDTWEAGKRLRWFDSPSFMGEGTAMATEWLLESAGGKTRLTLVQSGFGGESGTWDDLFDGIEVGWTYFLHHLRVYLETLAGKRRHMISSRFEVKETRDAAWRALLSPGGGLLRGASAGKPGDAVNLTFLGPAARAFVDIAIPGRALALRIPDEDALLFLEFEGKGEPFHIGAWLSVHDADKAERLRPEALRALERTREALGLNAMDVHHHIDIEASPAVVWRCLTEPALLKEWVPGYVDETPEDPARTSGVGVASTMRLREGSSIKTYRCVVTRWEPERAVAIRLSGGSFAKDMHMDVNYEVTAIERGCRVDFREQCEMKGIYRLLFPVIWLVSRGNATKALSSLAAVARREAA